MTPGRRDFPARTWRSSCLAGTGIEWLIEVGDGDDDGFLEYHDRSGHGLVNQGWKDSADAMRFHDGHTADGPMALCEVQGYAYEAASGGADLLDAFGSPGAEDYRSWASQLAIRFRASFWCGQGDDRYPALALDGAKHQVDSLSSNIGHLLGTGILTTDEELLIARRVASPALDSGLGLRTMAATDAGYAPLSYHCGRCGRTVGQSSLPGWYTRGWQICRWAHRGSVARVGCLRTTAARALEWRRQASSLPGCVPAASVVRSLSDSRCPRVGRPMIQPMPDNSNKDNSNKTALVTGASSGIGEATALQLAELGYTVYAAARRVERMSDLADRGIRTRSVDVTDDPSMMALVEMVIADTGRMTCWSTMPATARMGRLRISPLRRAGVSSR